MADVTIRGLNEVIRKLEEVGGASVLRAAMHAAAEHVKGKIAKYPPASGANTPGQKRWYERGYGPKWTLKSGGVHGYKTSETLGRKWTTSVDSDGKRAEVGNNVSYAPYVQDRDKQAYFHKARGWKTVQDVAEGEAENVKEFFEREIKRALK